MPIDKNNPKYAKAKELVTEIFGDLKAEHLEKKKTEKKKDDEGDDFFDSLFGD